LRGFFLSGALAVAGLFVPPLGGKFFSFSSYCFLLIATYSRISGTLLKESNFTGTGSPSARLVRKGFAGPL
jgi:hypothetical protein